MKKIFSNLNLKKKLGLIALVLGFFAIFAGSPYKKANITINAKNLALIAEKQVADVTPEELADWIIKGNYDFRVIDTRNRDQYNEYHIPVAQNISVADLMGQNFLPTEKIILYSNDEVKAAQAWFLLKAKKYNSVYLLKGGMKAWKDHILFPKIPDDVSANDASKYAKIKEISKYFGGRPQTGGNDIAESAPQIKMPKLELPANIPSGVHKKKRREGC